MLPLILHLIVITRGGNPPNERKEHRKAKPVSPPSLTKVVGPSLTTKSPSARPFLQAGSETGAHPYT